MLHPAVEEMLGCFLLHAKIKSAGGDGEEGADRDQTHVPAHGIVIVVEEMKKLMLCMKVGLQHTMPKMGIRVASSRTKRERM